MCGDYNLRREKRYVESAIRIRLQQMQVIKGKPIHCHPLDIMRFGE